MGCCLSLGGSRASEIEMDTSATMNSALTCKLGARGDNISVSLGENRFNVSGRGVALGSCPLDCDTARWEVVVGKNSQDLQIGVKRYNPKIKCDLNNNLDSATEDKESPAWLLQGVDLKEGDVVGVYWDQTDLPMLSFTVNGNYVSNASINRIRPSTEIYPAVSLGSQGGGCSFVFDESGFKHKSISSKFQMIICSSSLI